MDQYRILKKNFKMEEKEMKRTEFFDYLRDFSDEVIRTYMWSKYTNEWMETE